ncbi:MAG: pyrroline-5-carboxylate reductase [Candidatus Omnitrophica bacterium]|nr:pyrroline-5-carboxylate reductase [Candidatus Omnitrophota bacterium]
MKVIKKIGIIGYGNMGQALAKALLAETKVPVQVYDKKKLKKTELKGVSLCENPAALIKSSGVVVLAIKPQDVSDFLKEQGSVFLKKKNLLITIVAAIPTTVYEKYVDKIRVIRVMPNLAAKISQSVSFLSKGRYASLDDFKTAKKIFSVVGEAFEIKESFIDKVTSITGSGPGYVYFFMNSLYQTALEMGFNKKQAKEMVRLTFSGAVNLSACSDKEFSLLMSEVTSPGGTTEAGLNIFKKNKLDKIIAQGVESAYLRAKELSSIYRRV